jgi:hypothetical protein
MARSFITKKGLYVAQEITAGNFYQENPINFQRSFAAYETIKFGRMVQTTDQLVGTNLTNASGIIAGIAMLSKRASSLDSSSYAANDPMAVADQGCVTVEAWETVTPADTVRVVCITTGGKPVGTFVKTAVSGYTAKVNNAQFRSSAVTSGVVRLFIHAPMTLTAD